MKHQRVRSGFTIVELIVTITVIGILAGIVIVSYNGTQKKAQDASVQSDLEAIAGHLEASRVRSTPQEFPRTKAVLETLGIKVAKTAYDTTVNYNLIYCIANTGSEPYQAFTIVAKSRSGTIFMVTQDGFKTHSLTQADLTGTLCTTLGMGLVSNGLYNVDTWQDWVGGS